MMACVHVKLADGTMGIVCGVRVKRSFCACGRVGELLCDWKMKEKKSGTCDRPICKQCALEVGADKHLCKPHQKAYAEWQKRHPVVATASAQLVLY